MSKSEQLYFRASPEFRAGVECLARYFESPNTSSAIRTALLDWVNKELESTERRKAESEETLGALKEVVSQQYGEDKARFSEAIRAQITTLEKLKKEGEEKISTLQEMQTLFRK